MVPKFSPPLPKDRGLHSKSFVVHGVWRRIQVLALNSRFLIQSPVCTANVEESVYSPEQPSVSQPFQRALPRRLRSKVVTLPTQPHRSEEHTSELQSLRHL